MSALAAFKNLPANELRSRERERIELRLDDLIRALGAPGDWGYGTKLGELTQILHLQRAALAETSEA